MYELFILKHKIKHQYSYSSCISLHKCFWKKIRRTIALFQSCSNKLTKVDTKDRAELLMVRGREKGSNRVPLVTTFSRGLPNISNIFRNHLSKLHASDRIKNAFPEPPLVAHRKDANLEDILVRKNTIKCSSGSRTEVDRAARRDVRSAHT